MVRNRDNVVNRKKKIKGKQKGEKRRKKATESESQPGCSLFFNQFQVPKFLFFSSKQRRKKNDVGKTFL